MGALTKFEWRADGAAPAAETPALDAGTVGKEAREHRDKVIGAMRSLRAASREERASYSQKLTEVLKSANEWMKATVARIEKQIPEAEQFSYVEKFASLEAAITDAITERDSRIN